MSSVFSDDALHPGRDPNDSSWQIVRRPSDWATAKFTDAVYDAARMVVELAPRELAPNAAGAVDVTAPDGTLYRCDPDGDRVLRRGPCDAEFTPIHGFGGRGTSTGRLRRPCGLALDDRGWLYVADADNHRVQVVDPRDGAVVIVLGDIDDGLVEPVAITVGARALYVADRAGHQVVVFDRAFRRLRAFVAAPSPLPSGFVPSPIALGLDARGALLVADAGWSRLLRFAETGTQLADLPFGEPDVPACLRPLGAYARFARRGEAIVCAVDGRVEDLAWHRVTIDAAIPAGARIEVQTFADEVATTTPPIPWAPAAPVPLRATSDRPLERPVQSDLGRWQRARHGEYLRVRPEIARYRGNGPNGGATLTLVELGLAYARVGDVIELTAAAGASERATISAIPARSVRVSASGAVGVFGPGTPIQLRERDGMEPFAGPRAFPMLAAGEAVDLSAVTTDGRLADISVPHAVAALWQRGDLVAIGTAVVRVDGIGAASLAVSVSVAPPLAGDYRTSSARIIDAVGRLFVGADAGLDVYVPPDEPIAISGLTTGVAWTVPAAIRWVEPALGAVWLAPGAALAWADWEQLTTAPARGTDRGRYLWLRILLEGELAHPDDDEACATPSIRAVRLVRPRLSYLRYLPATFSRRDADAPTGSLFLERMLAMFERKLTEIESRYESVSRQLDPRVADPEWLQFIAGWFDLAMDPAVPIERRRRLVAEAHTLYETRGTPEGIRRYLEIVTGERPVIIEGFQTRPAAGLVVGETRPLGTTPLGGSPATPNAGAHQFTLIVFVASEREREQLEAQVRALIDVLKPAHTVVDLRFVTPEARVGTQSTIGVDFVLGDDHVPAVALGNGVLGQDARLASGGGTENR